MPLTVGFDAPQGMTLTLELYPFGSDAIANGAGGDAAVEATNDKGWYEATVAEALAAGYYRARIVAGSVTLLRGVIRVRAGVSVAYVHDHSPDAELVRKLVEADRYIETTTTPWQLVLIEKGSGSLTTGTRLLVQRLMDKDGENVTNISTFLGQSIGT